MYVYSFTITYMLWNSESALWKVPYEKSKFKDGTLFTSQLQVTDCIEHKLEKLL